MVHWVFLVAIGPYQLKRIHVQAHRAYRARQTALRVPETLADVEGEPHRAGEPRLPGPETTAVPDLEHGIYMQDKRLAAGLKLITPNVYPFADLETMPGPT